MISENIYIQPFFFFQDIDYIMKLLGAKREREDRFVVPCNSKDHLPG